MEPVYNRMARRSSGSTSPCSTITHQSSVTDLVAQFAVHRIRRTSQISYHPFESYANQDDDAAWSIPPDDGASLSESTALAQTARSFSNTRLQRQVNTRLLCTASHHRDISALVARMIDSGDQCDISSPDPSETSLTIDEDEGYNSSEDISRRSSTVATRPRLEYRRSSDCSRIGTCVTKPVRLRKETKRRRTRKAENTS